MKRLPLYVRILSVLLAVMLVGLFCNYIHTQLFSVHQFEFVMDPLFSDSLAKNINDFVLSDPSMSRASYATIFELLKVNFPSIKSIHVQLKSPGVLRLECHAYDPLIRINNGSLITDAGTLVPEQDYFPSVAHKTRNIQVCSPAQSGVCPFLYMRGPQFAQKIFDEYEIVWINEFQAVLKDTQHPDFSIVCAADSIPDERILALCQQLRANSEKQETVRKKKKTWVADVRFDKQIVLYDQKGGQIYG